LLLTAAVTASAIVAFAGCKKSSSPTSDNGPSDAAIGAQDYFVQTVYPVIGPACGSCHSGTGGGGSTFLGTDADSSYQAMEGALGLIADPSKSPLVQHIHTDTSIVLTPDERNVLSTWLGMESSARGLAGSVVKASSPTDAYQQFANCMNFDIWEYYRVGDLAFTQTDNDGPCMGCHSVGQGSAWLSAGSRETFEKVKDFPYIEKWVVATVDEHGTFSGLQPAVRFIEKSDEACTDPDLSQCHPTFGLAPNIQGAINGFVNTTLQNLNAGTCSNGITYIPDAGPDAEGGAPNGP
jgi:hypothetical protein